MYHSNFITLFISRKFYGKLFWNIRHSELDFKFSKKNTIFVSIICGLFSKFVPTKIIYCSEKSINFHQNHHFYNKSKSSLIYNGYSDNSYYPLKKFARILELKLVKKSDTIIGYAGRYAKQKKYFLNVICILKNCKKLQQCLFLYDWKRHKFKK